MSFQLFEVLGTHIYNMSSMTLTLFFLFLIIIAGYLIGRISVKGVALGSAAIFLVALFVGHFKGVAFEKIDSWQASETTVDSYFKLVQNFGLVLFVTSVGLIAGPTFFKNLIKNAKSYVLLGLSIILAGAATCALITILVSGMQSAMSVGLLSGSLTSTPAFAAAQESVSAKIVVPAQEDFDKAAAVLTEVTEEGKSEEEIVKAQEDLETAQKKLDDANATYKSISVGHAVAYPFGVIGVVLFVQIIPKLVKANMEEERKKLIVDEGNNANKNDSKNLFKIEKFGLGSFALAIVLGLILGSINIPMGAGSFSLGTTGGPLIVGLLFGHFGHMGKLDLKVDEKLLSIFQELGLILFLIGAGIDGGAEFVDTLAEYGPLLFLWGALMTIIPMIIGFFIAKYVMKLSLFNNLGSLCGGMTSTPALGALINMTGTPNVASAYAATYPIALVAVVLASQFLTYL